MGVPSLGGRERAVGGAVTHARRDVNHLPDGPEQRARDAALAGADPLVANGWIYGYDAEDTPVS